MAKKEVEVVGIKPIEKVTVPIRIIGDSPLIVHAWSEKAKKEILGKQTKATKTKAKEARNPFQEYCDALYWMTDRPEEIDMDTYEKLIEDGARFGFPVNAIKMAGNSAAYRMGWVKNQMELRASYFLKSVDGELAEIKGCRPKMREDMVRIGMGTADLRYRPEFADWYMDIELIYNKNGNLTLEQILNVINAGGMACGIGEWRAEKDGDFGAYHLEMLNA